MNPFNPSTLTCDYGNWYDEALACRHDCALFDFSFMSHARVSGNKAAAVLASFQNRTVDDMRAKQIRYSLRVNAANSVVADLTVWRSENSFDIMSGRYSDIADLMAIRDRDFHCRDLSAETAIFAVQGPNTLTALKPYTDVQKLATLEYFSFESLDVAGVPCTIGRLGYTGELGIEIIAPLSEGNRLWSKLANGIRPAGFAAIDCLRIEAGFMLFANDLALEPTASELGVDPTSVDGSDADRFKFICCTAKSNQDPVVWQPATIAFPGSNEIAITSACFSPVAQSVLVLGFAQPHTNPTELLVDPTGVFSEVRPVSRPFFDPSKKRPRGQFTIS